MAISAGVFAQVVLVIVFRQIKVLQGQHFNDNGLACSALQSLQGAFDDGFVGRIRVINAAAILCARIKALTVERGGVDGFIKQIQQKRQRNHTGIIVYFDGFGVAAVAIAHVFIAGVLRAAVGIAYGGGTNAANVAEIFFQSPKTAAGNIEGFCVCILVTSN